jgi:hypothetical protein
MIYIRHSRLTFQRFRLAACFASEIALEYCLPDLTTPVSFVSLELWHMLFQIKYCAFFIILFKERYQVGVSIIPRHLKHKLRKRPKFTLARERKESKGLNYTRPTGSRVY